MKILRSIKNAPAYLAAVAASAAMSSPAFADGFAKAETLLEKISSGLTGLAIVTITIAVIWVGYKVLWDGTASGSIPMSFSAHMSSPSICSTLNTVKVFSMGIFSISPSSASFSSVL